MACVEVTLTGPAADAYMSAWMQHRPLDAARLRRDAVAALHSQAALARLRRASRWLIRRPSVHAGVTRRVRPSRRRRVTARLASPAGACSPGRPEGTP